MTARDDEWWDEIEPANRVQVQTCGQRDHVHLVLYDEHDAPYAEAVLTTQQVLGVIEVLQRTLYELATRAEDMQ